MSDVSSVAVVYRSLQAIRDLVGLAQTAPDSTVLRLAAGTPPVEMPAAVAEAALADLIGRQDCRMRSDAALGLHETLLLAATLPDDDFEGFVLATLILLADRLQGGRGPDDLFWHFDAFVEHYALADAPYRAAIFAGYRALAEKGRIDVDPAAVPIAASGDAATIVGDLRVLAEAATEADLLAVAESDEGDRPDHHLRALRSVIHSQDCLFDADQDPVPRLVVDLAAHVPAHRGFVVATAILLVNALARGDGRDRFGLRWEALSAAYLTLPEEARAPILAGIRHLYETDPGFAPFPGVFFDPDDKAVPVLPPV